MPLNLYESASRSCKVVTDYLDAFFGYIFSDGYVAYSVFDDAEKYPEIIRYGFGSIPVVYLLGHWRVVVSE